MIPKIIHYCWFGGNPLPSDAIKCIESWKKFFPDYEIKQWDEHNFDVECCSYVKEAYTAKKWAFVSDYARFKILHDEGGIYFDVDVEVIRGFDEVLSHGPFMGKEYDLESIKVNPGLGMAAQKEMDFYSDVLSYYESIHFDDKNIITIVDHVTNLLTLDNYKGDLSVEVVRNINIYPPDYFCPMNYMTGELNVTSQTCSIHHYKNSWNNARAQRFYDFEKKLIICYGKGVSNNLLLIIIRNLYCNGVGDTINRIIKKIRHM